MPIGKLQWVQVAGSEEQMMSLTRLSKHLLMMEVRAAGRQSFRQVVLVVFRTGTIVACLKHAGTTERVSDVEKMSTELCATHLKDSPRNIIWAR